MTSTQSKLMLAGVIAASATAAALACTSWMIHPSATASGRMLVHKCRDNRVTPLDADILRTRTGVKWMRLGAAKEPLFAVNEHGVAAVMNDGDPTTTRHPNHDPAIKDARMWTGCGTLFRQVMNDCTTAEQATRLALHYGRNFIKVGHGNSIFFADAKRAFMIDFGPGFADARELTNGFCIVTNCLHFPGVETYSTQRLGALRGDRAREANVRASLQKHRANGKYTVAGTIATSRIRCQSDYANKFPCRRNSLSGVCFEIDPEFPQYLTTAYVALGPQQHTIYLPTPLAIDQFPEEIRQGRWSDMAYELRKTVGFDHKYLPRFATFEKAAFAEYDRVREEARRLLKTGQKEEAVRLLNDCYRKQFAAALKLMREVNADAAAHPPKTKIESYY